MSHDKRARPEPMPGCLSGIAWDYFTTSLLVRLRTSLPEPTTGGLDPCAGLEKTIRQKRGGLVGALGGAGSQADSRRDVVRPLGQRLGCRSTVNTASTVQSSHRENRENRENHEESLGITISLSISLSISASVTFFSSRRFITYRAKPWWCRIDSQG